MLAKSGDKSQEFVVEVQLYRLEDSSSSDKDDGPTNNDIPPVGVNRGTMTTQRMNELVIRYRVPLGYVCRIWTVSEYVSRPGPLEIRVCEESF